MGGAGRGGSAELTSQDQNTRQERDQGNGDYRKLHRGEEVIGAQTEAAKQTIAVPPVTKRNKESSTCTWTRDHSYHAQCTDDGGGWDARS